MPAFSTSNEKGIKKMNVFKIKLEKAAKHCHELKKKLHYGH